MQQETEPLAQHTKTSLTGRGGIYLQRQFSTLQSMGLPPFYFRSSESISLNTVLLKGIEYLNFVSYNYLGLSNHPKVLDRVTCAIQQYGTSCVASRIAGGEKEIHAELEAAIARFLNVEDSLVFVGGYTTNVSCIEHLFLETDLILYDALAHNSIVKGCQFSGATIRSFPHNDYESLETILRNERQKYKKVLIVIEGVYSMDGDIPDLAQFIRIKKEYDSALMIDEAHSIGTLGETGRGIQEYAKIDPKDVDIWMGTLSKSFASCGGYIAGTSELITYLRYSAPGFLYSVGISPANTAAALAAIEVLNEEPERVRTLQKRSNMFGKLCIEKGFNIGSSKDSPIVPLIVGSTENALYLSDFLFQQKIYALPLFYPAVEQNKSRLRFFISCLHTEEQIVHTVNVIDSSIKKLKQPIF